MERNERLKAADKCASRYTNENEARIAKKAFMLGCEFEAQCEAIKGVILDTLPEQTASEGLEEEVRKYLSERWKLGCTPITPVCLPNFTTDDLKECAEFFYRLGLINKK